jgi:hypothetical protein
MTTGIATAVYSLADGMDTMKQVMVNLYFMYGMVMTFCQAVLHKEANMRDSRQVVKLMPK